MTKNTLRLIILISLLATCTFPLIAQPGDPDPPDDLVPISGIEILLIGGGILGGAKALKSMRKKD